MGTNAKPKILGGDSSLVENAPYWENGTPLYLDNNLNDRTFRSDRLHEFPLIEDFEVLLKYTENESFGYHVYFFSRSRGYLAGFPWWDYVEADLIRENFQIPIGDFQRPFSDSEQSWNICIAAQDDFLYVIQGNDDFVKEGFYAWFKIKKALYLAAWQKTIDLCKSTFSAQDFQIVGPFIKRSFLKGGDAR